MQLEKERKVFLKTKWVSLLDILRLSLGYYWGSRNVSKIGHDASHSPSLSGGSAVPLPMIRTLRNQEMSANESPMVLNYTVNLCYRQVGAIQFGSPTLQLVTCCCLL